MTNKLKALLDAGKTGTNTWISLPGSLQAEFIAACGFDAVTIDMQHGMMSYESAVMIMQAIGLRGPTPMVRLPSREPSLISSLLDAGAEGLICPMVNTAEDCAAFIDACIYPPNGSRSFGPSRCRLTDGAGPYFADADGRTMLFAMIETGEALENLEAILATPRLYGVYIGPADLSLSLGHNPVTDQQIPEMMAQYAHITERAQARGLKVGFHCSTLPQIEAMAKTKVDFLTLLNDNRMIMQACEQAIAAVGVRS